MNIPRHAAKSLAKIDRAAQKLIKKRLFEQLATRENPTTHPRVTAMVGSATLFRYRIAHYRVLFKVQQKRLIIFIVDAGHRLKIYARAERIKQAENQFRRFGFDND